MKTDSHPIFARVYDQLMARLERTSLARRRAELLEGVGGKVLELGAGSGANLPYYKNVERLVLSEPDPSMRRSLLQKHKRALVQTEICNAPAEELPFDRASFDSVVSTLVLCSVQDPERAISEIQRVLRPGGALYFLEHIRKIGPKGRWQDWAEGPWSALLGGCHPNRRSIALLEKAGFVMQQVEYFDPAKEVSPWLGPALRIISPCVQGLARDAR